MVESGGGEGARGREEPQKGSWRRPVRVYDGNESVEEDVAAYFLSLILEDVA
jgi:hypothetical protein